MKNQPNIVIGICLLAAGCAQFQHQTAVDEPHGLVRIVKPADYAPDRRVVKLDGLRISQGRDYRVTPGDHLVTIQLVERSTASYEGLSLSVGRVNPPQATLNISESGEKSITGANPLGGVQPLKIDVQERRINYVTNKLRIEAGSRYDLDGYGVEQSRVTAP